MGLVGRLFTIAFVATLFAGAHTSLSSSQANTTPLGKILAPTSVATSPNVLAAQTEQKSLPATTTNPVATVDAASSSAAEYERGIVALAKLSYDWQTLLPGWRITFHKGKDKYFGLTRVSDKHIEIFVRPNQTEQHLAHVIAHEMGHAVDVTLNTEDERELWRAERDLGEAVWWPRNGASDFNSGAGDFAESFAVWQVSQDDFKGKLQTMPDSQDLTLMQTLAQS